MDSITGTSSPARPCLITGSNTTARQRTMRLAACTSFSIATSSEGMPIAATEIDFLLWVNCRSAPAYPPSKNDHFSDVLIDVNLVLSLVPSPTGKRFRVEQLPPAKFAVPEMELHAGLAANYAL